MQQCCVRSALSETWLPACSMRLLTTTLLGPRAARSSLLGAAMRQACPWQSRGTQAETRTLPSPLVAAASVVPKTSRAYREGLHPAKCVLIFLISCLRRFRLGVAGLFRLLGLSLNRQGTQERSRAPLDFLIQVEAQLWPLFSRPAELDNDNVG